MKESRMEQMRHELLADVFDHVARVIRDHNIAADIAEQAATAVANRLAEHWGGQFVTIPKDYFFKLSQRDLDIYEQFNGHNYPELARKYNISVRAIYKIIAKISMPLSERDHDIYKEFNGTNQAELASKYNMSVPNICRILANAQAKRQQQLF